MVDIGNIIKTHLRQTGSSVNQLAKQIKISDTVLYHNFKTNHLTLARLELISRTLHHNFFIYFVQQSGSSEEQLLKLSTENREMSAKLASLQKENTLQQEIIALLKAKS